MYCILEDNGRRFSFVGVVAKKTKVKKILQTESTALATNTCFCSRYFIIFGCNQFFNQVALFLDHLFLFLLMQFQASDASTHIHFATKQTKQVRGQQKQGASVRFGKIECWPKPFFEIFKHTTV